MKFVLLETSPVDVMADAVVVGIYEDAPLAGAAAKVNDAAGKAISRLKEAGELSGKKLEITSLLAPAGVKSRQVIVVGLGKEGEISRQTAFRVASAAARHIAGKKRPKAAFYLGEDWSNELNQAAIAGVIVGSQGQDLFRKEKARHPLEEVAWAGGEAEVFERGRIMGESVNLTRRLVDGPPQDIYPESYAAEAEKVGKASGFSVEVWDEKKLADERCGSLLAVARGSDRPARLVMMKYEGAGAGKPFLALVGKGVTFDSGGYSLKPTDGMKTMKCDMAGAATVLGAMQAIAQLKLPVNVMGFAGLVENLVSGKAFKLGDVLTARSGKTIEVLNTDAEGRLVLADVLCVAVDRGVDKIVDLATLTGACVVALGEDIAGLMTNNEAWADEVKRAAKMCGEEVWPLPMFAEFGDQIKSDVADIKNVGNGRWGGAMTAAKFLEEFVSQKPWVHLDIAGPAFREKAKPWMDAGASGLYVETLVELAKNFR